MRDEADPHDRSASIDATQKSIVVTDPTWHQGVWASSPDGCASGIIGPPSCSHRATRAN